MKKILALLLCLLLMIPAISVPASAVSSGGFMTYYWSGSIKQQKIGLEYDLIATGVRMDDTDIPEGTAPVFQKEHGAFPYEFSMTMRNSSNSLYYPDSQAAEAADCPGFSILLDGTQIVDGSKTADLLSELHNTHPVGTTTGTLITAYFLDRGNRYIYELGGNIAYDEHFGWGIENAEPLELDTKELALGKHTLSFTVNPKYRSEEIDPNNNTVSREFYIKESAPAAPEAPVLERTAATSITVKSVPGQEYSIDGGVTWQDSGAFSGLTPETAYEIVSRVKETETVMPGQASPVLSVTTTTAAPATPKKPELKSATAHVITVVTLPGLEYSIDGGSHWQTSGTFEFRKPVTTYEIIARVKAKGSTPCSEPSEALIVTTPKQSIIATPAAPTIACRTDSSITLEAESGMEYTIDDGTTWQTDAFFTGLTPDTEYSVLARFKESALFAAGPAGPATTVRTKKSSPAAPAAPRLLGRTDTTISVC